MRKNRCHQCGGRFGLIRRRYMLRKFCSASCIDSFKHDRRQDLERRRFHRWLYARRP